jgi:flagellar hook-associated protein 2
MSGSASISGLGSGLDTASIVDQLMQLEQVPQAQLRSRVSSEQLAVNAMQTLNSKIASLASTAANLSKHSAWTKFSTSSTNDKVTVTASESATPMSISVQVGRTALSHRLEFTSAYALDTAGTVPTSVSLDRLDGKAALSLTTDGTLAGLVKVLNDPANKTGVTATAVQVSPGQYRLLVESTDTGAASDFTLTDTSGGQILGGQSKRAGQDAQITLGSSLTVTSSTNTFTDITPGVSITLAPDATGTAVVSLTRDNSAVSAGVKALVDAVNAELSDIDGLTAYDPATKASGLLAGNSAVRDLRGALLDSVFPADGTSLSSLGIQTDRSGKLVFDQAKFEAAYAADPAGVEVRFTAPGAGFADRVRAVASTASDSDRGTLTQAITGRKDAIGRLNDNIADWDIRLALKRETLERQFTALNVALSQMNSQSSWLAGQIANLPGAGTQS